MAMNIAIRPSPNQVICRAGKEPAWPVSKSKLALYIVITPTATNARESKNSGQSKCEISRRSICTSLSVEARFLLVVLGRFLYLDKLLVDFFRHGRCRLAAVPAVFDQNGDRDLGLFHRRIGHEPGVIAVKIAQLFALEIGAFHFDHLRRASLAGDENNRRSRRAAGAARAMDDVGQRFLNAA